MAALTLLLVGVFSVASVVRPLSVRAVTGEAQQLLNLINQERAAVGAQPLTFRGDLVQIATGHSAWMASTGNFQHRSDLSAGVTGPWTRIGENIAYGWGVTSIHQMFMESNGHCENNLYAGFDRAGIEFATGGNGAMYVTVVFVQESGASLPAPVVCPYDYSTTTTAAPTTTTAAPTTTTTAAPTTTTAAPTTTTTAAPTTTTAAPTTTTAPPTTTTTAAPTTTTAAAPTTTTAAQAPAVDVVLQLSSTTTTPTAVPAPGEPVEVATVSVAAEGPPREAKGSTDESDQPDTLPVLPVAGVATVLAAGGAWWVVEERRAAARAAGPSRWEIPNGGVRPPQ